MAPVRLIEGQAISQARSPLFFLPPDGDLPPLPGEPPSHGRDLLAIFLEELIAASSSNRIPAPCLAPDTPSLVDAFAALQKASAGYEVAPGVSLTGYLWTHAATLRDGTMSAKLRSPVNGAAAQGFLALYASEVSGPLVYCPHMSPIRVRDGLGSDSDAADPFLVLVVCEASPAGHAKAIRGYAIPVYHARRFFPVSSNLDRDVLRALEHLQVTLDAYGAECAIRRELPFSGTEPARLTLSLSLPDRAIREINLGIAGDERPGRSVVSPPQIDFLVTSANWEDGTFIDWLGKTLP